MLPLRDTEPSQRKPFITWFLIGLNVLIFLFQIGMDQSELLAHFYAWGMVPLNFSDPAAAAQIGIPPSGPWTFLTSMFMHGGFGHLIFNMWALWIFGDNVEDKMGRLRYLLFYLLVGLLATGVHLLVNLHSPVPVVGASGALAGVMAAYMFMFPKSRILTFIPVFFLPFLMEVRASLFIGIWFFGQLLSGALGLFSTEGSSGVAFWAHIGGFAAGWLLYRLFLRKKGSQDGPQGDYVRFEEI